MSTGAPCTAVYICDLQPGLSDSELMHVFGHYGEVVSMERVDVACEEAAVVEYSTAEAAEEAQGILNFAVLQGKTCRCILLSVLERIQQTMEAGHRLVVENLDPSIESRGFHDVCALFGQVLDCKVELDDSERSRGLGFAHYARSEEALKALTYMGGVQIGDAAVEVRRFEHADGALFTGCLYELPRACPADGGARSAMFGAACEEEERLVSATTPQEREQAAMEHFKTLEYHHVEVIESLAAKLQRLKVLIETYDPNQDRQMIVVANAATVADVLAILAESVDQADYDFVEAATPKEKRQAIVDNFATGNLYILVLASEIATRRDFDLGKPAAVLVNIDFPNTIQLHLYRIYRRADSSTRIHSFFSSACNSRLAVPLMSALQDAGHDIPAALMELWSREDQSTSDP